MLRKCKIEKNSLKSTDFFLGVMDKFYTGRGKPVSSSSLLGLATRTKQRVNNESFEGVYRGIERKGLLIGRPAL